MTVDLRQHPAGGLTGRAGRLHRRPRRARLRPARQVRAPRRRARLLRVALRPAGPSRERYIERDWAAEPWAAAARSAIATGGWTASGPALREPVGPIHWAGAETATRWSGYIDGAVSSGERAAARSSRRSTRLSGRAGDRAGGVPLGPSGANRLASALATCSDSGPVPLRPRPARRRATRTPPSAKDRASRRDGPSETPPASAARPTGALASARRQRNSFTSPSIPLSRRAPANDQRRRRRVHRERPRRRARFPGARSR